MAGGSHGAKKAYYDGMTTRLLATALLLVSATLPAAEQLPDSANVQRDDDASLSGRFSSPPLDSEAMQNLYLESPVELGNTEEEGLRGVDNDTRYSETDLLFRERLQGGADALRPRVEIDRPEISAPPLSAPQQL